MLIKVSYLGRMHRTRAVGEYDSNTGKVTVLKGSVVSETIAQFKETETIRLLRNKYTDEEGILLQDVVFNSPSSAAAFVSGYSVNGLTAWHVEKHKTLKRYLQEC